MREVITGGGKRKKIMAEARGPPNVESGEANDQNTDKDENDMNRDTHEISGFFRYKSENIRDLPREEQLVFRELADKWERATKKKSGGKLKRDRKKSETPEGSSSPQSSRSDVSVSHESESVESNESSTSSSEVSSRSKPRTYKPKGKSTRKRNPKSRTVPSSRDLSQALRNLDIRKTPSPGMYDAKSGLDLTDYLRKFEVYCENNFKGDKIFWIDELEQHLEGKIKAAYQVMRTHRDSYNTVKKKLLEYYQDRKRERKIKQRAIFRDMKINRSESVYFFAARIEKQYRVAYPSHSVRTSQTLRDKFTLSLPKAIRTVWKSQMLAYKMSNVQLTWKTVLKWAKLFDAEQSTEDGGSDSPGTAIVINVGERAPTNGVRPKNIVASDQPKNLHGERPRYADMHQSVQQPFQQPSIRQSLQQPNMRPPFQQPNMRPPFQQPSMRQPFQRPKIYHPDQQPMGGQPFQGPSYRKSSPKEFYSPDFRARMAMPRCEYCYREGHERGQCRKMFNLCFTCGDEGHYAKNCPNRMTPQLRYNSGQWESQREESAGTKELN